MDLNNSRSNWAQFEMGNFGWEIVPFLAPTANNIEHLLSEYSSSDSVMKEYKEQRNKGNKNPISKFNEMLPFCFTGTAHKSG